MQSQRATNFSSSTAVDQFAVCTRALESAFAIGDPPDASSVLDSLVGFHVLVRSSDGQVRFQHQQFQEWFAAEQVHSDLTAVLPNDDGPLDRIRREVCNLPQWEESLILLLERLRDERTGWAANAASWLVRTVFSLDAFFGATLLRYLSVDSSAELREEMARHLRALYGEHDEESRQYGLACMLASRVTDFGDVVWPLLGHDDQQVRLTTNRIVEPFPLESLGPNWWARVRAWSDERRREFLGDLILGSDRRLASELACTVRDEPSDLVRSEILEDLAFAGYRDLVRDLVHLWGPGVFCVDQRGVLLELLPVSLLVEFTPLLREAASLADDDPVRWNVLAALTKAGDDAARQQLVGSANSVTDEHSARRFRGLLSEAASEELKTWLSRQMREGRVWESKSVPYLKDLPGAERDTLIEAVIQLPTGDHERRRRLRILTEAWPLAVGERLLRDLLDEVRSYPGRSETMDALVYELRDVPL